MVISVCSSEVQTRRVKEKVSRQSTCTDGQPQQRPPI